MGTKRIKIDDPTTIDIAKRYAAILGLIDEMALRYYDLHRVLWDLLDEKVPGAKRMPGSRYNFETHELLIPVPDEPKPGKGKKDANKED